MKLNDHNFYLTQGAEGFDEEILESSEDMNCSFTQVDQEDDHLVNMTNDESNSEDYIDLCISQSQLNEENEQPRACINDNELNNTSNQIPETLETLKDPSQVSQTSISENYLEFSKGQEEEEYIDLKISQSQGTLEKNKNYDDKIHSNEPENFYSKGLSNSSVQSEVYIDLQISQYPPQESRKTNFDLSSVENNVDINRENSEEYIDLQISRSPTQKSQNIFIDKNLNGINQNTEINNEISEEYIDLQISQSQLSNAENNPSLNIVNARVIIVDGMPSNKELNEISNTFPTQLDEFNSQFKEIEAPPQNISQLKNDIQENQSSSTPNFETREPSLGSWLEPKNHLKFDNQKSIFAMNDNPTNKLLERFNTLDCANILSSLSSKQNQIISPKQIDLNGAEEYDGDDTNSYQNQEDDQQKTKLQRIFNTFQPSTPGVLKEKSTNQPNSNQPNNSGSKIKRKFGSTEKSPQPPISDNFNNFDYPTMEDTSHNIVENQDEEEMEIEDFNKKSNSFNSLPNQHISNEDNSSNSESHNVENRLIQQNLPQGFSDWPNSIPASFVKCIPEAWGELWGELEEIGWFWTKGKGLIDFFYIKPNCRASKPFKMGIDFFPSGEEVFKYIKNEIEAFYIKFPHLKPKSHSFKKDTISQLVEFEEDKRKGKGKIFIKKRILDDEDEEEFLETPEESFSNQEELDSDDEPTRKNNNKKDNGKSLSNNNSQQKSDNSDMIKYDIRKVEWKNLWRFLREKGWTWDFGPGTINYYYLPGYSYKQDKQAILGTHKFDTEEAVRRYIRKEIQNGRASDWPMFFVPLSRSDSMLQESQQADAHLLDPEWNLVKYRKKREGSSKIESEMEDQSNEFETKKPKSRKFSPPPDISNKRPTSSNGNSCSSTLSKPESANKTPLQRPIRVLMEQPLISNLSASKTFEKKNFKESSNNMIFNNWKIMFSGIREDLRDKLEKVVLQQGGKVIADFPSSFFPPQSSIPTSNRLGQLSSEVKHKILLISQPKDFRKPKYLYSLIAGIPVIHFNWVADSAQQQKFLPLINYLLPSGYSALHSYYYYPDLSYWDSQLSRYNISQEGFYRKNCLLFIGKKVLNLTNMKIWDDILNFCGMILVSNPFSTLNPQSASNSRFGSTYNIPSNVDYILFDPVVYTRSIIHYQQQHNQLARTNSKESSIKHILSLPEVQFLQANQSNTNYNCVVSIDWFTHCIALNEVIDQVKCLDLFTLPSDPIRYPIAYKSDLEYFQLPENIPSKKKLSDNSKQIPLLFAQGERFSKYDLVSFKSNILNSSTPGSTNSEGKLSISSNNIENSCLTGKILGFTRRNEKSPLLVRINILELVTMPSKDQYTRKCAFPVESSTQEDVLISIDQLTGKFVLLEEDSYESHVSYFSEENISTLGTNNKPFANVTPIKDKQQSVDLNDILCSTSPAYHRQNPLVLYTQDLIDQFGRSKHFQNIQESESDDEDDNSQGIKRRRYNHIQASQDI